MRIRIKTHARQLKHDAEYDGTIQITVPEVGITRTFAFQFRDATGRNTMVEINTPNGSFSLCGWG